MKRCWILLSCLAACTPVESDSNATQDSGSSEANSETSGTTERGVCIQYLECVAELTPEIYDDVSEIYGEDGICWDVPGQADGECWGTCRASMQVLRDLHPDVTACDECTTDDDCSTSWYPQPSCGAGECGLELCGNGRIDTGEQCDEDAPGNCDDCVLAGWECSVFDSEGTCDTSVTGEMCRGRTVDGMWSPYCGTWVSGGDVPHVQGYGCQVAFPGDAECEPGFGCFPDSLEPMTCGTMPCCLGYCDTRSSSCTGGTTCVALYETFGWPPVAPGLSTLGVCVVR